MRCCAVDCWPERIVRLEAGHTDCGGRLVAFAAGFPGAATDRLIRDAGHGPGRLITATAAVRDQLAALEAEYAEALGLPVRSR
ncbi:hypothetical protein PV682_43315 [Streptomyces niveiscabiei]|uniref:hypothetical protein n=1 Tax=Streptomyces niveiscabiei TaxID=164115 RepID=UPI0029A962B4|nr:hypothetical protein [Streptomyces niveiscabiei]MDX3388221.1 hypothetical protein [Streptomyces niveiscabiei]